MLTRLESARLYPGEAADAWEIWAHAVRQPDHRLYAPSSETYVPGWRPYDPGYDLVLPGRPDGPWDTNNPSTARRVLETVAHALPGHDAREFRKRLAALDELW